IFQSVDDNTVVFVLGDHGMTEDGNHGGATPEETGAALLVWSRSAERLLGPPTAHNKGGKREGRGVGGGNRGGEGGGDKGSAEAEGPVWRNHPFAGRKVAQIDLVPTVSLLLGTPIPFGSLGGVIPEVFGGSYLDDAGVDGGRDDRGETAEADPRYYERLCDALLVNSIQVWKYLGEYSGVASMPKRDMFELHELLTSARDAHEE
ncbi:unnamed protein product, partial [Laminaria digitata]